MTNFWWRAFKMAGFAPDASPSPGRAFSQDGHPAVKSPKRGSMLDPRLHVDSMRVPASALVVLYDKIPRPLSSAHGDPRRSG
jgi:hypothetical protein